MAKDPPIEKVNDILLDLERARKKEKEEKEIAEALLKSLESISNFNQKSDDLFMELSSKVSSIIEFKEFAILMNKPTYQDCLKVFFSNGLEKTMEDGTRIRTIPSNVFLSKASKYPRNISKLDLMHGLGVFREKGSCLSLPFSIYDEDYLILFFNENENFYTKKHMKIGQRISSVFKQGIINRNLVSKLMYSDKMASIGVMAAGIAHEINNPLAIIDSTASVMQKLLKKGALEDDDTGECLDTIRSTTKRIYEIIKGLRTISRKSENTDLQKFDLKELIDDVFGLCAKKFSLNEVELNAKIETLDMVLNVASNRTQLSQVLLNLLNNAHDAVVERSEDKWIELKVEENEANYFILVIDSGKGISGEMREKIFTPFFTSKEIGKGTGLGLSISLSIMQKLSGNLELDTAHENTCFKVTIPKSEFDDMNNNNPLEMAN